MNANPPERPQNQLPSRRSFMSLTAASIITATIWNRAMAQTDVVDDTLNMLREKYPHLLSTWAKYDQRMQEKIVGKPNQYSINRSANSPRLPWALEAMISHIARGFKLDPIVLRRLVLNETDGRSDLVSHKWAQGLTQIMPITQQDFYKRLDTRYASYLKALPANFADKFANKDIKYAVNRITTSEGELKNIREGMTILGGSIFDTEANLFLGSLYLAGLKGEIVAEGVNAERIRRVLTGFNTEQISVVNKHRARIWAPMVPAAVWSQVCSTKLTNTPSAATYIEALARYNGGGSSSQPPLASAYGYAGSILI